VNRLTSSLLQGSLKRMGGVASERSIPLFARQSMTAWFRKRRRGDRGNAGRRPAPRGKVVLWPDTFTTYLAPEVGQAAVRVLEAAGFEVVVPQGSVCCGLTWISTGQLGVAKRVLRHTLNTLEDHLQAGVPIVGLEPSCTAVFRHEAADLLPEDPRARLAKDLTHTLAELLATYAPDWQPPAVAGEALVQPHCHQHAVMGFEADSTLLNAAGIRADIPDSGCCGLAGNFGFEREHYDLSMAAGERVLLPAVRAADAGTLIVADGFSCRTQIKQGTGRRPLHLAQVLAAALDAETESAGE
jgi:Fe-S oxidoreductase